jgi:pimeloyl-ACP methyl ester carboxylesterase
VAEYALADVDLLDGLGVERCDAVGIHSGSSELVELATAHPERVRRLVAITLFQFPAEQREERKAAWPEAPELREDGRHLDHYWGLAAAAMTSPEIDLPLVQEWMIDILRGRGSFASVEATIDYDLSSRIGRVRQPLLVLGPHDDVWEHMEPLLPLLPAQAEFVDLPHVTSVFEVLTRHREEIASYINRFLR